MNNSDAYTLALHIPIVAYISVDAMFDITEHLNTNGTKLSLNPRGGPT